MLRGGAEVAGSVRSPRRGDGFVPAAPSAARRWAVAWKGAAVVAPRPSLADLLGTGPSSPALSPVSCSPEAPAASSKGQGSFGALRRRLELVQQPEPFDQPVLDKGLGE